MPSGRVSSEPRQLELAMDVQARTLSFEQHFKELWSEFQTIKREQARLAAEIETSAA